MKRELSLVDEPNQFFDRGANALLNLDRISKPQCVFVKLRLVQNCVSKIRRNQQVYVQIYKCQYASIKSWRRIDVTIIVTKFAGRFTKAKDTVPAVHPVMFDANGTFRNLPKQRVVDFRIERPRQLK